MEEFLENPQDADRGKHNYETMEKLVGELKENNEYVDTQDKQNKETTKVSKKIKKSAK